MMNKKIILLLSFTFIASCSANVQYTKNRKDSVIQQKKYFSGQILKGRSSYYADKFHGKKTANGETFDMHKLTAAHRYLPFGTILNVINLANNKSVRVRVNDRGPFVGDRILDLSYGAAKKIGMISTGVADVKVKIIRLGE